MRAIREAVELDGQPVEPAWPYYAGKEVGQAFQPDGSEESGWKA